MIDTIRNIIIWTLALSAAFLILTNARAFNDIVTNLTGNWAKLLVVSRGQNIPRI